MMNKNDIMKHIAFLVGMVIALVCASCSSNSYINAIPEGSTALIAMDLTKLNKEQPNNNSLNMLKKLLQIEDVSNCGIDLESKLYLFESPDNNLGLCAKVADEGDLKKCVEKLIKKGVAKDADTRKGFHFATINNTWVAGYSNNTFLVMGPAIGQAQAVLRQQMVKYFDADEDQGIKGTPLYEKIDSINSPIALVAQASALPEKFVTPFTLGAPKEADASQIIIAAKIKMENECLVIDGSTFSFNKDVNDAIKKSYLAFRPLQGKYAASMPSTALMGLFVNVDGKSFLPMLQANKGLQAMLAGINAAIDMDNIIRSVNGEMAVVIPSYNTNLNISMAAQLANANWLADVGYWKQSCPKGGRIADWGPNSYYYTDGNTSFYFGVSTDKQFFSGNNPVNAKASIDKAKNAIDRHIQQMMHGKKLCMIVNIGALSSDNETLKSITSVLSPVAGNIKAMVYTIQ